jgi:hypothetical protein
VTHGRGQRREVCPARACQLARLTANNMRLRDGWTKHDADEHMAATLGGRPQTTADADERWSRTVTAVRGAVGRASARDW